MRFSIIIATCDRPERLRKALKAVVVAVDVHGRSDEIIVVDNGSRESAESIVADAKGETSPVFRYVRSTPRNKSAALNKGIEEARCEWLAFTDDDAEVDPSWLVEAERFLAAHEMPMAGGRVCPVIGDGDLPVWLRAGRQGRRPSGAAWVSYAPINRADVLPGDAPVPLGANVFVRADIIAKYGGYDEVLWENCGDAALGVEDAEFGIRMRRHGVSIGYMPEAIVCHPLYSERTTLAFHLRWAFRKGVREAWISDRPGGMSVFLWRTVATSLAKGMCYMPFDSPVGLCELMEAADALGQLHGQRRRIRKESATS